MAVIDQIDIRRGNASGTVTTTTYDIGAKAENVILSDGSTVEDMISGGAVKFEGFGRMIALNEGSGGADPVVIYELYNNPNFKDNYNSSDLNKMGLFIIKFPFNISFSGKDCTKLRLAAKGDCTYNSSTGKYTPEKSIHIIKNEDFLKKEGIDDGITVIFLRNCRSVTPPGELTPIVSNFEWVGDNHNPRIVNGDLVLI